jgi:hypothetical protein
VLSYFSESPSHVRWELCEDPANGIYHLKIYCASGMIVESYRSRTAALVRQAGLEEQLAAAWNLASSGSA